MSLELTTPQELDLEIGSEATAVVSLDVKAADQGATFAERPSVSVSMGSGTPAGFTVAGPEACKQDGDASHLRCTWEKLPVGRTELKLKFKAVSGVDLNMASKLVSLYANSYNSTASANGHFTIQPKTPVALAMTGKTMHQPVLRPGDGFPVPVGFQNVGKTPQAKTSLMFLSQYGIEPTQRFSNCRYGNFGSSLLTVCDFDTPVGPGESMKLADDYRLKLSADIPVQPSQATYEVLPTGEMPKRIAAFGARLEQGQGARLTLVKDTKKAEDRYDNAGSLWIEPQGQKSGDLVPAAAEVRGKVGEEAKLLVSVKNTGPGAVRDWPGLGEAEAARVVLPAGVSVLGKPETCRQDKDGDAGPMDEALPLPAGSTAFTCVLGSDDVWKPGTTREFVFKVKVTPQFTGTRGAIAAMKPRTIEDESPTGYNTAEIVFNTKAGADTTGGAATAGGSTGGAAGTTGGSTTGAPDLAETGADSSSTPVVAAAAAGLLVVAGGAFAVVRRRKVAAA